MLQKYSHVRVLLRKVLTLPDKRTHTAYILVISEIMRPDTLPRSACSLNWTNGSLTTKYKLQTQPTAYCGIKQLFRGFSYNLLLLCGNVPTRVRVRLWSSAITFHCFRASATTFRLLATEGVRIQYIQLNMYRILFTLKHPLVSGGSGDGGGFNSFWLQNIRGSDSDHPPTLH